MRTRVVLALSAGLVTALAACSGGGPPSSRPSSSSPGTSTSSPGPAPSSAGPSPSGTTATGTTRARWIIAARALDLIADDATVRRVLDSPDTYVLVGATSMPAGWQGSKTVSFTSAARLEAAVDGGQLAAGTKAVLYDNEGWTLTPADEQRDPAAAMTRAAAAAHRHGLMFIAAPAVDLTPILSPGQRGYGAFLSTGVLAAAAKVADVVVVQAQGSLPVTSTYLSFVRQAAQQIRAARPGAQIVAGISTGPSGLTVTLSQLRSAVDGTQGLVDGYWLNIPSRSTYCPRCGTARPDLVKALLASG